MSRRPKRSGWRGTSLLSSADPGPPSPAPGSVLRVRVGKVLPRQDPSLAQGQQATGPHPLLSPHPSCLPTPPLQAVPAQPRIIAAGALLGVQPGSGAQKCPPRMGLNPGGPRARLSSGPPDLSPDPALRERGTSQPGLAPGWPVTPPGRAHQRPLPKAAWEPLRGAGAPDPSRGRPAPQNLAPKCWRLLCEFPVPPLHFIYSPEEEGRRGRATGRRQSRGHTDKHTSPGLGRPAASEGEAPQVSRTS